jgi:hypothetical protein
VVAGAAVGATAMASMERGALPEGVALRMGRPEASMAGRLEDSMVEQPFMAAVDSTEVEGSTVAAVDTGNTWTRAVAKT